MINQFSNNQTDPMQQILKELDEIKRYVAATYDRVDTEIQEIQSHLRVVEREINNTDRQLLKIENFDRHLNKIEGSLRNIERRIK